MSLPSTAHISVNSFLDENFLNHEPQALDSISCFGGAIAAGPHRPIVGWFYEPILQRRQHRPREVESLPAVTSWLVIGPGSELRPACALPPNRVPPAASLGLPPL